MPKKRLLILSVSTGSGHVRAADAIRKTAAEKYPGLEVMHVDMVQHVRLPMKITVLRSYDLLIKQLPELWGFLYKKTDDRTVIARYQKLSSMINRMNAAPFCELVRDWQPDYILCTHFLPAQTILEAPKKYGFRIPPSILMTDYDKHMFLLHPRMREYFVATEKMKYKLLRHGIAPERIIETGIPVDPVFYQEKSAQELKKKYRLPADRPVLLVLAGGQGLAKTEQVVRDLFALKRPVSIVAIAGSNKKLEGDLSALRPPRRVALTVVGWTDAIDEYMRLADIILTKPGGMTTTECIALGKPMIAVQPIPGQEEHNAEYVLEHNFGRVAHSDEDMLYYAEAMLDGALAFAKKPKPLPEERPAQRILRHVTAEDPAA